MWIKIFGVVLLALALTACESENTNTANENKPAATTPAPATSPATTAPASSPAASMQVKAGDKVKVNASGTSTDATVVSVDEKAAKATVKIAGQKENKTVPLSDIVKQ
jgi:hypothetical protein